MRIVELWRVTRFRLALIYGAMFAVGVVALLGLIYWQTAGYMTAQVDQILRVEAAAFDKATPEALPGWLQEDLARDARHISLLGLFSADGVRILGNVRRLPRELVIDGPPRELRPTDGLEPGARALAVRLPWGEVLVVGRDATQLVEIRRIILHALFWSGGAIVAVGLALAALLSVRPLQRVGEMQLAAGAIVNGDFKTRLPVTRRRDELDMLAGIVNAMLDEIERLIGEVKSAGDSLAHDLRTPLTRLRGLLYRVSRQSSVSEPHRRMVDQALEETDILLGRFRALLRVSEIESGQRHAGFSTIRLPTVVEQIQELYEPVALVRGVKFSVQAEKTADIQADADLLFEAVSNLVDNAIKFTPKRGRVLVRLEQTHDGPRLQVIDSGPGVAAEEREAVLQRFYRSDRDRLSQGSGLGLSIVAAIARLHGFRLTLEDAHPGLCVSLDCWRDVSDHQPGRA